MKIVKFKDGSYGIRKITLFGFLFLDLANSRNHWWAKYKYPNDIKGTLDIVTKAFENINDYGTPVKDK